MYINENYVILGSWGVWVNLRYFNNLGVGPVALMWSGSTQEIPSHYTLLQDTA